MKATLDLETGEIIPRQSTKKSFVCWWEHNWKAIIKEEVFTLQEQGALHRLGMYISYRDNTLRKGKNPMTKTEIGKILGLKKSRTREIIENLKRKNALIEEKDGRAFKYTISPYLCWKGTEKDDEYQVTQKKFQTPIRESRTIGYWKNDELLVRVRGAPIPIVSEKRASSAGKATLLEKNKEFDF